MKRLLVRASIAGLTLGIGLLLSGVVQSLFRAPTTTFSAPLPQTQIAPSTQPNTIEELDQNLYPETTGIEPYEIEWFIEEHPNARLKRLWNRLGVRENNEFMSDFYECAHCKAESFEYDLDGEIGDETLLRIADEQREAYRYLVFKLDASWVAHWKLLGHIDAWGKYTPSRHMVLLSGGKPWLIVSEQGASGSGISLYLNHVLQVDRYGLREIVAYRASGFQSGYHGKPSRRFDGRVMSYEIQNGQATVTVAFRVEFFTWTRGQDEPLFSKEQTAVIVQNGKGGRAWVDPSRSNVTQAELDSIYNIDSMTDEDFLQYNQLQLHEIAIGTDSQRKTWLRNYLTTLPDSSRKRELSRLLANG